ncbi:hypothetical protein VPNG_07790 [Cytospora leucostoma]|uniref:Uncharacterized protein n=1 Tax=Cytospora leucostoma TaxID=1230097 RepID=A0A423WEG5_9PEZI|nr:hypothetical protein VPNG_07790 [Cytospora leucostoma]
MAPPRAAVAHSGPTVWELDELLRETGGYRTLVPHAALNVHGRAVVEESYRNTPLNNFTSQIRQNTPFLPPDSRLQFQRHSFQLCDHERDYERDYENTPLARDSVVPLWRGDHHHQTEEHRNIDCDRFLTQARQNVPLRPTGQKRYIRPGHPDLFVDERPPDHVGSDDEDSEFGPPEDDQGSGQATFEDRIHYQHSIGSEDHIDAPGSTVRPVLDWELQDPTTSLYASLTEDQPRRRHSLPNYSRLRSFYDGRLYPVDRDRARNDLSHTVPFDRYFTFDYYRTIPRDDRWEDTSDEANHDDLRDVQHTASDWSGDWSDDEPDDEPDNEPDDEQAGSRGRQRERAGQ